MTGVLNAAVSGGSAELLCRAEVLNCNVELCRNIYNKVGKPRSSCCGVLHLRNIMSNFVEMNRRYENVGICRIFLVDVAN